MPPPVLLLHGFATSARRTWAEPGWVDLLKEAGRSVIAPDLLGHGDAAKPHDSAAYSEVESLIEAELPEAPVDAVGYSAGARILLVLASRNPERFNRLVIGGLGGAVLIHHDGERPSDPQREERFQSLINTPGNDPDALGAFLGREQPRLDVEHLAAVTCPTLVILGDKDFSGPGEPLADAMPNAKLVTLRGVDHFGLPKSFDFVDHGLNHLGAAPF